LARGTKWTTAGVAELGTGRRVAVGSFGAERAFNLSVVDVARLPLGAGLVFGERLAASSALGGGVGVGGLAYRSGSAVIGAAVVGSVVRWHATVPVRDESAPLGARLARLTFTMPMGVDMV